MSDTQFLAVALVSSVLTTSAVIVGILVNISQLRKVEAHMDLVLDDLAHKSRSTYSRPLDGH